MQAHLSISVRADAIKSEVNPGSEDPFAVLELGSSNAAFNFMTLAEIDALIKAAAIMKRRFEATLSGQRHEYAPEEHLGHCDTCGQLRRSPLHQVPEPRMLPSDYGDAYDDDGGDDPTDYSGDPEPELTTQVVHDLLLMVSIDIPREVIDGWTDEQRQSVADWAGIEHLIASDNDHLTRVPKPEIITDTLMTLAIDGPEEPISAATVIATLNGHLPSVPARDQR
jgi:hypothetical protein